MAIEANELRIGNLVFDHLGRVQTVAETRVDAYICYLSSGAKLKYKLNTAQPIPLTEKWLLKLDFTKDEYGFFKWGFYLENRANDTHSKGVFKEDFGAWINNSYLREIRFVHQLQNLIFALYGEELTVKL